LESPGGVIDTARELGIAIIAYSPTGRGLVTGRYTSPDDFDADDFRRTVPKYSAKNFPRILKLVEGLKEVAAAHKATPAQITLAWLLAEGSDIIPIPGSKQIKYTEENLAAAYIKLTPEEVKNIRTLCDSIDKDLAADGRYGAGLMDMIYKETPPLPK